MTRTSEIRRRADGSIDTEHYLEHARRLRSQQFHAMTDGTGRQVRRLFAAHLRRPTGFLRPSRSSASPSS